MSIPKVEYMNSPGQRAGQATLWRKLMVRQLYDYLLSRGIDLFAMPGWSSDGQYVWLNMQSHLSPHILCKLDIYRIAEPGSIAYSSVIGKTAVEPTAALVKADVFFIDREHLKANPRPAPEFFGDPVFAAWRTPYVRYQTAVTIPV